MIFLWDSNILRHYLDDHSLLLENLKKVSRQNVMLPVVVVAEQLRGRTEAILKSEPSRLASAQEIFRKTQKLLNKFQILYFDEHSLAIAAKIKGQSKTRGRYADVLIAAQTIPGGHIVVTRNTKDFLDLLPASQIQNWIDEKIN
jgi:predicted nucleic acid-binding protein